MNLIEQELLKLDAFPYDDFPKIKKAMQPYEEILDKLLVKTAFLPEYKTLFQNAHKVKLYTSAKPMFGVLNLTNKKTGDFIGSCVIIYPPYIDQRKKVAHNDGAFFSDDVIVFSLAHELGHLQQILDGSELKPREKELLADSFGACLTAKAGYSVLNAIKGLPVLAAEQESAEHPPLSERRLKLIDFALKNGLLDEKEKQEAVNLRQEIESFIESKKSIRGTLATLSDFSTKKEKQSGELLDVSSLKMGISRVLAKASIEILGEKTKDAVIEYFKDVEDKFKTHAFSVYDGWIRLGVDEYDKLKKDGIIDAKGRILNLQELQQSTLVTQTPRTFHYAGGRPVQLCQAPSLNSSSKGMLNIQKNNPENC